ncbi:MAG: indole-3-glycerol phosphate synthase TrpC [Verrucomicrobiota bacterium]|nr:indole-3-glycerol phosphate synthase TrpC [Verrucomicrobiota bacterium]
MDVLRAIMAQRKADAAAARRAAPLVELEKEAKKRRRHSLVERLNAATGTCVIAETKKASPSAGLLRARYRPGEIARGYEKAGAVGISVLTEPRHFLGSEQHLREVRKAVDLPVLRKDFLCDPYQVAEAAAWGADVVLLIAAALSRRRLWELYEAARGYGMEVLVEARAAKELKLALALPDVIVGVNNRNLKTLKTDLAVAEKLADLVPKGRLAIAESGIKTRADITELEDLGYRGFLIGEALMRCPDPAAKLRALIGKPRPR